MRVTMGELLASSVDGAAPRVIELFVPRDVIDVDGWGLLGVKCDFEWLVQFLERGSITTCGHGTSDVREGECEDESSDEDHCETARP